MPGIIKLSDRLLQSTQLEAIPFSVQAPITGWNTRDALDAMEDTDAIILDNFFPDAGGCTVRGGSQSWATGLGPSPVKTLASAQFGSTKKLIAACSGSFFDVSPTVGGLAPGPVGAALVSGFKSDAWQYIAFLQRLFFMNGVDTMQVYDGSVFTNAAFTGVALSTIVGGIQYQQRLFFWQNNSTGFWFAPLNSLAGTLSFYDLSGFCPSGGNLINITTYSSDGGSGVQDFIVFIMSTGDALVYMGNDPSNIGSWYLVGRYTISPPVNIRATCKYGAEAYITTYDDHIPLSAQLTALIKGELPPHSKISSAVSAAVKLNPNGFGWQAIYYAGGRRILFNIPDPSGLTFTQHVFNTQSPAWCRFTGMNAFVWCSFGLGLFFGGAGGIVYQADVGSADGMSPIVANGQQAWTMLPGNTRRRISAVRPIMQASGNSPYVFYMGFDYQPLMSVIDGSTQVLAGSPWDTSPWDTSRWSPEAPVDPTWKMASGTGQALSSRLQATTVLPLTWLRSDFKVEQGEAL